MYKRKHQLILARSYQSPPTRLVQFYPAFRHHQHWYNHYRHGYDIKDSIMLHVKYGLTASGLLE
jgi:hypothetical protein